MCPVNENINNLQNTIQYVIVIIIVINLLNTLTLIYSHFVNTKIILNANKI